MAFAAGLSATPGDLDGDGALGVTDHLWLAQALRGERALDSVTRVAADFDGDGSVTDADLNALRDWLLERYAPAVVSTSPAALASVATLAEVEIRFNKRYHEAATAAAGVVLVEAGADGHVGTEDDVPVPGAADLHPPGFTYLLAEPASATSGLGPGVYGLSVGSPIADFQGRTVVPFATRFLVTGGAVGRDSDFDGVIDTDEIADGTNPLLGDTDGDWADDGLEKQSGTDPKNPFSVPGETGAGRFVGSLIVSYANLPVEGANTMPPDATFVSSALVSYANMPVEAGNATPVGATFVSSVLVSYANMPVETGNTVPAGAVFVISPIVSYVNRPVESPAPTPPPQVIVSALVSYQNNG